MNVKELREELNKYNDEDEVVVRYNNWDDAEVPLILKEYIAPLEEDAVDTFEENKICIDVT